MTEKELTALAGLQAAAAARNGSVD
jgi:hypothetical protein